MEGSLELFSPREEKKKRCQMPTLNQYQSIDKTWSCVAFCKRSGCGIAHARRTSRAIESHAGRGISQRIGLVER